ncbi:MAG: type II secretion system F family protein [Rubripirellula sp.]
MKLNTAAKFSYRLGTGLKAGADLIQLLQSEASLGSTKHRAAIWSLVNGTKSGSSLSDLMQEMPYFPRLMTSIVRVGEETGKVEQALLTLSHHYEHQITTRRSFLTSIAWPTLQLVAGILIISLLIYLLGILTPSSGGQMTDILGFGLRGGSGVLWFWFYLAIFFGAIAAAVFAFLKNVAGVQNMIPLLYRIPVFGPSIQTITITRLCWTLSLGLGSGLDPIRSIALALDSTDSDYYRNGAKDAELAIRGGASLSEALHATEVLPSDFIQRIDIAELSGVDAESLAHLSKEYDERAKQAIKILSGIATGVIRVTVMGVLIFLIFRIASSVFGFYQIPNEPIDPHRRF